MNLSRLFPVLLALLVAFLFAGCASDGASQKVEPEKQIVVGMTKDEVKKILGPPDGEGRSDEGETWTYHDTAKAFIPFYAIGGGKFHFMMIVFDNAGKVIKFNTQKQGIY